MSNLYRCTNKRRCGARRALKRKLEDYVRTPRCRCCGGRLSLDNAQRKRNRQNTCKCDAKGYPHRSGSDPWCSGHPTGPTGADYEARYGR